jgi:hypothetical protein
MDWWNLQVAFYTGGLFLTVALCPLFVSGLPIKGLWGMWTVNHTKKSAFILPWCNHKDYSKSKRSKHTICTSGLLTLLYQWPSVPVIFFGKWHSVLVILIFLQWPSVPVASNRLTPRRPLVQKATCKIQTESHHKKKATGTEGHFMQEKLEINNNCIRFRSRSLYSEWITLSWFHKLLF